MAETIPAKIFTLITLCTVCAVVSASPSKGLAQDTVPPITGLGATDTVQLPLVMGSNRFGTDNLYLEDTLHLQYQISLLERMVERQAGIARLEKNYMDLGVMFDQPAPPHGICRQIPANIPCFRAYPDLYDVVLPEYSMIDTEDEITEEEFAPEPVSAPEPQPIVQPPAPRLSDSYRWAEILCGGGVCSATLIKSGDPKFRRTVQEGDTLEDGTITVTAISSMVKVTEGGKETELTAALAPSQGGPSSPYLDPPDVAQNALADSNPNGDFMRDVLDNDADISKLNNVMSEEPAEEPIPFPEDEPIEDPGSPLGPTGLF